MSKINYNWRALRGDIINDEDYCRETGIPASLAYTPEINEEYIKLSKDPAKARRELLIAMANIGVLK